MFTQEGRVTNVTKQNGTSNAGKDWHKTTVVIDTGSEYGNIIPFQFFNQDLSVKEGQKVKIEFYLNGREYNGKYYVDLSGKGLTVLETESTQPVQPATTTQQEAAFANDTDDSDGMPF